MRPIVLGGAHALVVAACGSPSTQATTTTVEPETTTTTSALTTSTSPTSTSTTEPAAGPFQEIAFMLHESGGNAARSGPFLAPVVRNTGSLEDTVREVLYGLTSSETDLGITTAIPAGTDLNSVAVDDGVATVDLTSEFDDGGGSFSHQSTTGTAGVHRDYL